MSKKQSKKYYVRKWLNKNEGKAFIEVTGNKKNSDPDLSISIGDCYRYITLEFDVYGEGDSSLSGRLAKMDLIISELQKAREWLSPPKTPDDN